MIEALCATAKSPQRTALTLRPTSGVRRPLRPHCPHCWPGRLPSGCGTGSRGRPRREDAGRPGGRGHGNRRRPAHHPAKPPGLGRTDHRSGTTPSRFEAAIALLPRLASHEVKRVVRDLCRTRNLRPRPPPDDNSRHRCVTLLPLESYIGYGSPAGCRPGCSSVVSIPQEHLEASLMGGRKPICAATPGCAARLATAIACFPPPAAAAGPYLPAPAPLSAMDGGLRHSAHTTPAVRGPQQSPRDVR